MLHSNPMMGSLFFKARITPLSMDHLSVKAIVSLYGLSCVQDWSLYSSQRDGWGLHLAEFKAGAWGVPINGISSISQGMPIEGIRNNNREGGDAHAQVSRAWNGSWVYICRRVNFLGPFLSCSWAITLWMCFLCISLIMLYCRT